MSDASSGHITKLKQSIILRCLCFLSSRKYFILTLVNTLANGSAFFENVNNCSNINIYSYFQTSGGQSYNLYLNVIHFFNHSVN